MKKIENENNIKEIVDKFLLFNLFLVILFAIYFIFSIFMQINGNYSFMLFFQKIWNPLIVPLITVLIISSLLNGLISWFQRQVLASKEDIET